MMTTEAGDSIYDTRGLLREVNPISDILNYVLDIINWEEIAEHLIDDYESEVK